ncbi:MAG: hypothetical protein VX252_00065 [Myxococcota bacterium]|nr:hypothetical protein [Myxococcota bacterium]
MVLFEAVERANAADESLAPFLIPPPGLVAQFTREERRMKHVVAVE